MREKNTSHLSAEQLERFLEGELSREENARVVRHLLSRCRQCHELAAAITARDGMVFWEESKPVREGPRPPVEPLTGVFLKLLESQRHDALRFAHERLQGIGLLAELERLAADQRLGLIRAEPRFHHWGLFDRILVTYLEYSRNSPEEGVQAVRLALEVLDHLSSDRYSPALLADFRASALGALGNAKRLAGSFEEARLSFAEGWRALEGGTGDLLEEAHLLDLEASLFCDLGQFDVAIDLLNRAAALYQAVGDDNRRARSLIQQALAIGHPEPVRGIAILRDALQLLDPAEEPRLELCARHNLAWLLNDAGEPREALTILEVSRPLYRAFGDSWTQLRLHWLEGRIALTLRDLANAEAVFQKISRGFERRGMHFEQTLVAVDLVEVYCLQGRLDAAVRLVEEFLPVLTSWGMHVEGLAMWMLFRDAVIRHATGRAALSEDAFRGMTLYFHRSWRRPMRPGVT